MGKVNMDQYIDNHYVKVNCLRLYLAGEKGCSVVFCFSEAFDKVQHETTK